jgi:phage shock protein E
MIDANAKIIMLDVRELDQRAEGEILSSPNGENIAITKGSLEFEVIQRIKDKEAFIVTYCRGGFRCALSAQSLKKLGYKNVKSLQGGVKAWLESGYSVETPMGSLILKK